jgi:hypothetical protein
MHTNRLQIAIILHNACQLLFINTHTNEHKIQIINK